MNTMNKKKINAQNLFAFADILYDEE